VEVEETEPMVSPAWVDDGMVSSVAMVVSEEKK
jgi:hypothetical protein